MPQHKSCKKRKKTSEKARMRNRSTRSQIKTAITRVLEAEKKAEAEEALKSAVSVLDSAARKRTIHRNKAARQKSALSRRVNSLPS